MSVGEKIAWSVCGLGCLAVIGGGAGLLVSLIWGLAYWAKVSGTVAVIAMAVTLVAGFFGESYKNEKKDAPQ